MSRQFRVAVIGAGIGAAHVEAYLEQAALYRVAVVCDLDAARDAYQDALRQKNYGF